MLILAEIRKTDARSKGLEGGKTPDGELLQDLIFFILHLFPFQIRVCIIRAQMPPHGL